LDQVEFDAFEADATAVRMVELVNQPLQGKFDLKHLCAMHRHLFQDVYDWAGEIRTVDISRGASRFANFNLIEAYLTSQLDGIAKENYLQDLAPDAFVSRLAHYLGEINAAHPFREGTLTSFIAFCSAALTKPVQSQFAVMGDMSLGGTVVPVRNLAECMQVAFDAGAKRILLPMSSVTDIATIPGELFAKFQTRFYSDPVDAVFKTLGVE
jgi:hypothetical protein